jgi:ABC-2 type transport system permease protein
MPASIRNMLIVARREYTVRARSKAFLLSTVLLMVLAAGVAAAPIAITLLQGQDKGASIAVHVGAEGVGNVGAALGVLLNTDPKHPVATFSDAPDLGAARQQVVDGKLAAVIDVERAPSGDLAFTYYAADVLGGTLSARISQAATTVAIQDRLSRAGISPAGQAAIFAPADFTARPADPSRPAQSMTEAISASALGYALTILIFMAILIYGQWIAMSVAEEKSSRVMEVVLNAASPTQLLGGKVLGVGGVALTQYAAVAVPAVLVLVFQPQLQALFLGGTAATFTLPQGLTFSLFVVLGLFFVGGFALYALLYAAAGSLVSRQEDLNQVIGPLTMLATLGYLLAAWSASGLVNLDRGLLAVLAYVPFLSPYMMLARYGSGSASLFEVAVALVILAVTIVVALWVAVRIYSAGVLLYGQRPGLRKLVTALRTSR